MAQHLSSVSKSSVTALASIDAEFKCFLIFASYLAERMMKFTEGNPFVQLLHDTTSLKNHNKHLAVGAVMFEPNNFSVVCLCETCRTVLQELL